MSTGLRIIWSLYLIGVTAVAVSAWVQPRSDQPNGAGGGTTCACFGFAMLILLAAVTGWGRRRAHRDQARRGFDVIR